MAKWWLFAPVAILALYNSAASAEPHAPVTVTVYTNPGYNQSPPLSSEQQIVGVTTAYDIWHSFDQIPMFNQYEDFVVRYDTHIVTEQSLDVRFLVLADDGTRLYLDDVLITDDWRDKGGGGSVSAPVVFTAGVSQRLTLWFYENGGAAWVQLYWDIGAGWERVPISAFSHAAVTPTTTVATTTEAPTTTTEATTTTSTTTTVAPTITVYIEETIAPSTTATPIPTTTQPISTTSVVTTTTIPQTTTTTVATLPPLPTTTSVPADLEIDESIDPEIAVAVATDPEILETLTSDQAVAVFDALQIDELSDSEVALLIDVVQNAPDLVRRAFEQEIDVFSGATDSYIPLGSLVNVATRRVLVVSVAFTIATPIPPSRRSL